MVVAICLPARFYWIECSTNKFGVLKGNREMVFNDPRYFTAWVD